MRVSKCFHGYKVIFYFKKKMWGLFHAICGLFYYCFVFNLKLVIISQTQITNIYKYMCVCDMINYICIKYY